MRFLFIPLFFSVFFISCSSDDNIPVGNEGRHVFSTEVGEVTLTNPLLKKAQNLEPAYALITISDDTGNLRYNRQKFAISQANDKYVTEEIILEEGNYNLIEFIVTNENDAVISLAPKANSALAQFSGTVLPIGFSVEADKTSSSQTESIEAEGFTAVDFGYGTIDIDFPDATDFFSLTVDDSNELTTKILNLKSINGSIYLVDWGDGTIEEYVSTIGDLGIENQVLHNYEQQGVYTITITGAIKAIELLDFGSDQDHNWKSHLTSIGIEKLALLKSCQLYSGNLTTLNTSENKALEFLGLGYNQVTSLDFTNNLNLKSIWLRYNQLTELNVSQNPILEFLWVEGNEISNLDLSNNSNLKIVLARENNLGSIDFSGNLDLERFDLSDNSISTLDISVNSELKEINVGANQLNSIDLSKNINLVRIDLYQNQLDTIDLSTHEKLKDLYINNNLLSEIDLSNNPELQRLILENNNFTSLNLTNTPKIFDLEIGGNLFDAVTLDEIIAHIHEQAISNTINDGYMDFKNNPGSDDISNVSLVNINQLVDSYNWFFNNN